MICRNGIREGNGKRRWLKIYGEVIRVEWWKGNKNWKREFKMKRGYVKELIIGYGIMRYKWESIKLNNEVRSGYK